MNENPKNNLSDLDQEATRNLAELGMDQEKIEVELYPYSSSHTAEKIEKLIKNTPQEELNQEAEKLLNDLNQVS